MSTNKNYFDLIDSYLNGEMTNHEAIEFESQLQKDPLLENEFQLQKDIVNSIREFRQAELKATLNTVDVGVGGTFTVLKVAAGIGVMALLGLGVYYFSGNLNKSQPDGAGETSSLIVEKEETEEAKPKTETKDLVEEVNDQITKVADDEEKNVVKTDEPIEQEAQIPNPKDIVTASKEIVKSEQPEIKLPEVVEAFDKEEGQISENIKVPENKLNKVTETYLPKTEVVEVNHRKYSFHYQFYNNKLYLYGEFDNKYEILELNTPAGISIYMFYKDNFYELEQNQEKITPLNAIQDSTLMRDLKTIREN